MGLLIVLAALNLIFLGFLMVRGIFPKKLAQLLSKFKRSSKNDEEIKIVVGEEEPLVLEKEDQELIESVVTFGKTMVKEVMTPRIDMVCVPTGTLVSAVIDKTLSEGYSKFPVYQENIDNIVGIVYLKDLMKDIREGRMSTPVTTQVRKPYLVPESKKVDDLLREMQKEKISMAIVVDEYGGTEGLVTVEDLVEEIVGEIDDEHDRQLPDLLQIEKNTWLIDGQINLEDLNQALDTHFPTEEFETLAGYLYGLMGKVPRPGDKIETDQGTLEAAVVHRQRISKVKFTKKKELSKALGNHA